MRCRVENQKPGRLVIGNVTSQRPAPAKANESLTARGSIFGNFNESSEARSNLLWREQRDGAGHAAEPLSP